MKKVLSIIGARPQFIKHSAMQSELEKIYNAVTIHTGQHYDQNMSEIFFNQLSISKPDYILEMNGLHLHGAQTGFMLQEIEKIVINENPNGIIVYGDTNSTLAGCLVAAKLNIPLIHIEAGLRSFNREMPEEINRIIADEFSYLLFCPTNSAIDNLKREGISHDRIFLTGDLMCDMVMRCREVIERPIEDDYYFATIHRPYNTDIIERLTTIFNYLNALDLKVFLSLHPRTLNRMETFGISKSQFQNIEFCPPVGYLESIAYQKYANAVITDSGGVQKEAYLLGKKAITLRSETEWVETLNGNWNTLLFDNLENLQSCINLKPDLNCYMPNIYGDGNAGKQIAEIISKYI